MRAAKSGACGCVAVVVVEVDLSRPTTNFEVEPSAERRRSRAADYFMWFGFSNHWICKNRKMLPHLHMFIIVFFFPSTPHPTYDLRFYQQRKKIVCKLLRNVKDMGLYFFLWARRILITMMRDTNGNAGTTLAWLIYASPPSSSSLSFVFGRRSLVRFTTIRIRRRRRRRREVVVVVHSAHCQNVSQCLWEEHCQLQPHIGALSQQF